MLQIITIQEESPELDIARELFRQYEEELNENLCFQSFGEELANPLKKYGQPAGTLLLAFWNDEPAGCIALTPLSETGICEMKRLYVKPEKRQYGIGKALVDELLATAIAKGYKSMRLDTLAKLHSAVKLYERYGFQTRAPYYNNPLPGVIYMEKSLV